MYKIQNEEKVPLINYFIIPKLQKVNCSCCQEETKDGVMFETGNEEINLCISCANSVGIIAQETIDEQDEED